MYAGCSYVVHLSVQQIGLLNCFDLNFLFNPLSAILCNALLLEFVCKFQTSGVDNERLFLRLTWV
jgi:hypothetical protein